MLLLITVLHLFTPHTAADRCRCTCCTGGCTTSRSSTPRSSSEREVGSSTALAACVPFVIHAQLEFPSRVGMSVDNWLEIATFLVIGVLFGALRDFEENKTRDLQAGVLPARGGVPEARGARHPADQRPGLHAVDSALDHVRRADRRTRRLGCDGQSGRRAHARHVRVRDGAEADQLAASATMAGLAADVTKVLAGRLPLALRETTLVTRATARGARPGVDVADARGRRHGSRRGRDARGRLGHQGAHRPAHPRRPACRDGRAHRRRRARGAQSARRHPRIRAAARGRAVRRGAHREAAEVIKQEIDRLDKVIKALLDFGRPSKPTLVRADLEQRPRGRRAVHEPVRRAVRRRDRAQLRSGSAAGARAIPISSSRCS